VRTGGVKNLDGDFHHDPKCFRADNFFSFPESGVVGW